MAENLKGFGNYAVYEEPQQFLGKIFCGDVGIGRIGFVLGEAAGDGEGNGVDMKDEGGETWGDKGAGAEAFEIAQSVEDEE